MTDQPTKRMHAKIPLPIRIVYEAFSKPSRKAQWKDRTTHGYFASQERAKLIYGEGVALARHYCVATRFGLYRLGSVHAIHLADGEYGEEYSTARPPLDTAVTAVLAGNATQDQVLAITETYLALKVAEEERVDLLNEVVRVLRERRIEEPLITKIKRQLEPV